jgi:hypothetical protein
LESQRTTAPSDLVASTCWVTGSKRVTSCVLALKAYPIR